MQTSNKAFRYFEPYEEVVRNVEFNTNDSVFFFITLIHITAMRTN